MRFLPDRLREAADAIDELILLAGPWNADVGLAAAPGSLREYADSLTDLLVRVHDACTDCNLT